MARVESVAGGAVAARLSGGRLHLQHGPIDVVLRAFGEPAAVARAERGATARFATILGELVAELPALRRPMHEGASLDGAVARRMRDACAPFVPAWITPMAAVAGAVADELLATMLKAAPGLERAYVNDGGDIAIHVAPGHALDVALAAADGTRDATTHIAREHGVGGVATSGRHGRSFSLGIADAVTVLARDAATADAAATLIANAVDCADAPVTRVPANALDPDSDLGTQPVTVAVDPLTPTQVAQALASGAAAAERYAAHGLVVAAALRLHGRTRLLQADALSLERA